MKKSDIDSRDAFFDELYKLARKDSQIIFLTADMGAKSLIRFKQDLKKQYINLGVAEQNMVSIAAGLSLGGKKVFIYTIIPFLTLRCYEQIKIDLCCMNLPVTIVGVGPGLTYGSDGPTHHATDDIALMRVLPGITILNPSDSVMTKACLHSAYKNSGPTYVRIDKGSLPVLYNPESLDFSEGLYELSEGTEVTIVATGIMVHQALKVANELTKHSISAGVVDLYRIKPLNKEMLLSILYKSKHLVTIEENTIIGGIGSMLSEIITDNGLNVPLKRIAVPDVHCFESGKRQDLHKLYNLDVGGIVKIICGWIKMKGLRYGSKN